MRKSGSGILLARASEPSSSFQLGCSRFIISLTSLTSGVAEALLLSSVFIFHTLFLYFETAVIKYTLRNVGSAPTRHRRLSRYTVWGLLPVGPCHHPCPPGGTGGMGVIGNSIFYKSLVRQRAEIWPRFVDLTLRNCQDCFSSGFPSTHTIRGQDTAKQNSQVPVKGSFISSSKVVRAPIVPHHWCRHVKTVPAKQPCLFDCPHLLEMVVTFLLPWNLQNRHKKSFQVLTSSSSSSLANSSPFCYLFSFFSFRLLSVLPFLQPE